MHRISLRWAALALMVGFSAPAAAVDHDVSVFLSDDAGSGTDCDHGALARIDLALQTNTDGSGQVTASSFSTCNDGSGSFGAAQALPDNVGPIAMGSGLDGFHPVEFSLPSPIGELPDGATLRLVVVVSTADDVIVFSALPNTKGEPILFVVPAGGDVPPPTGAEPPINIPVTGSVMLAALLLGILLVVTLGKRYRRMLPVLLLGASAGLMAQAGGFRFDWSDGPLVGGESVQPDAYIGIRALFVRTDRTPELQFAFRLDLGLESEPVTLTVAGSPLLLEVGGPPGELTLTNTSTFATTGDLWAALPPTWLDVWQDSSDCRLLAPGASCTLVFAPGAAVHASETVAIGSGNTIPVNATIEVRGASVPVLTAVGSPLQLIANGPPGSIVVTNLAASLQTATNVRATLPPGWGDVTQDASGCTSLAPGASCTLLFTPGAIVHPAESIAIAGDDTQAVTVSIEVTPPVPTLLAVTPNNGSMLGGTEVVLTGANLEGATAVVIGSWEAALVSVSGTQIEAVTAASPSHGAFDVTVVTPTGNVVLQGAFSYTIPVYRLGGIVTGLAGTLVLANALNGDSLTVTADGPFTMPIRLQAGFGYNVVVATQPAGQVCTVVNGQSFINGVDSDNVLVTCAPAPTYTVGGEVSGLVGEVVLAINGGETVALDAAVGAPPQPFAFPTALPSGSGYEVLVQSQSGWLACTVSNGSGTIGSTNVANVLVACELPGAALFSLSPASGSTLGGITITANGEGFTGATALMIDGVAAAGFSVISDTQIEATLPPHAAGEVAVYVASPVVSDSNPLPLTYVVPETFTVGGTLAGLAPGETIVLQNNGGDDQPLSGNGIFTFATPVVDGGSYNVSVSTQPVGQTCTVVNGTGTLAGHNITNVEVNCTSNTYTIGGAISGLTAAGLVLHNNGADMLVIAAGATSFTFPTPLANGSPYNVSIVFNPTGLQCTIANGSGTVAGSNVASVLVTCEPSTTLVSVSPDSGSSMGGVGVTLTGTGFIGATSVTFDGVPATSLNVINSTTITAVTPAHAAGIVNVSVQRPGGTGFLHNGFTYVTAAVGQPTSGGVLACLGGGLDNLVATASDQGPQTWSPTGVVTGATSLADGATNTVQIVAIHGGPGVSASTCASHQVDSGGNSPCQAGNTCFNDWFLPARSQLQCLRDNRVAVGGLADGNYWSSSENDNGSAWALGFMGNTLIVASKLASFNVRCMRAITP